MQKITFIERMDRPTTSADSVGFDQLFVGPVDMTAPRLGFSRSGGQLVLVWPAVRRAANLETTAVLDPPITWTSLPNPAITNGQFLYSTAASATNCFFRLRRN